MRLIVKEMHGGSEVDLLIADTGGVEVTVIADNGNVAGQVTIHIESGDEVTSEPAISPEQVGEQIGKLLRKLDTLGEG